MCVYVAMPLWLYHDIIVLSQSAPTAKVHMMLYKIQLYSTTLTNAKTRTNARKKLGRWILVLRVTLPGASRFSLEKRKKRVCIPRILGVRERERERERRCSLLRSSLVLSTFISHVPWNVSANSVAVLSYCARQPSDQWNEISLKYSH